MNPRDFIPIELLIFAPLLYVLLRAVRPWALSPVWLLLGGYLSLAVAGRYALKFCVGAPALNLLFHTPISQLDDTLAYFLFICIAFSTGVLFEVLMVQAPISDVQMPSAGREFHEPGFTWTVGMLAPLALYIFALTPAAMLHRTTYLTPGRSLGLNIASGALLPFGTACCGAVCLGSRNRLRSAFAILIVFAYFVANFAMATRRMALVPLLFALGALSARPDLKIVRWLPAAGLALGLVLLPVPLYLRGLPDQGLIPFIHALGKIAGHLNGGGMAGVVLSNILFAFPLTNYIGTGHALPMSYFWIDVNPLPGRWVGWYRIVFFLLMDPVTPYNALGELLNYGYVIAGLCFAILGVYFAHLERSIREWTRKSNFLIALVLLGFAAFFILLSIQYPLRSSVRLIYYGIVFEALVAFILPAHDVRRVPLLTGLRADTDATPIR